MGAGVLVGRGVFVEGGAAIGAGVAVDTGVCVGAGVLAGTGVLAGVLAGTGVLAGAGVSVGTGVWVAIDAGGAVACAAVDAADDATLDVDVGVASSAPPPHAASISAKTAAAKIAKFFTAFIPHTLGYIRVVGSGLRLCA